MRIIGDGGYKETLLKEIKNMDVSLKRCIQVQEMVVPRRMGAIWSESDIGILVSEKEGTAVSMLEAMAHGCVPVVTRAIGTSAVIQEGVNGFSVAFGCWQEMAEIIDRLHQQRSRLCEIGRKAHATGEGDI